MAFPWAQSCKRQASEVLDSAPKRTRVDHHVHWGVAAPTAGPELIANADQQQREPQAHKVRHRRSMAVANPDIQAETDAGYKLAKMAEFKPGMSVQEKLSLGFRTGLQKRDEHQTRIQQEPERSLTGSRNEIMALGGIDLTDHALGLPISLRQGAVAFDAETKKRSSSNWQRTFDSSVQSIGACRRLTTVMRPYIRTIHTIPGLNARRRAGQIMNVEWQHNYHGMSMNMSFSALQARSMELNGYRRRTIQCIHFQREEVMTQKPFPGPPLGADTAEAYGASSSTEMFFGHDQDHRLSLVDLYITDINGVRRRWVCIEIAKPLVQVKGPVPMELTPMPQSYVKIAAPGDKILILKDTSQPLPIEEEQRDKNEPPQLGDFEKLSICGPIDGREDVKMRLRMCRDGMPIFATGSKKGHIPGSSRVEDFLSASEVTGLPWKETDRRVHQNTVLKRKNEFWDRLRSAAEIDKQRWASLQDAIARNDCVVDITFQGEWQEFAPVIQASQSMWTPALPPLQPGTPRLPHTIQLPGLNKVPRNRYEGKVVGPRSSGLRNEVHW
ncbi:hypothetical protein CORC01_04327 [Colletotrichum orchidophilum]|uniref:Uncharacterized protein n=1 Tax=Colletotrichum orchidophilum TaxID=1209926 RepID=A0A1G4BG60_9PEZI|nr:uncharacterized protein CORC01_04327 [Colletotrichum orchidophilum]OHF00346.1 hypothetical protein CORC01_04327 [Colletotrichum orchidophilum]